MKKVGGSEMKEGGKRIPAFFKVFLPQTSSQRLQIPLAFGTYMKGMLPVKAYLRDINENIWPIEVVKSGDKLFFQDGWVEFVEQNGVEEGDFLVFQFDGDYVFDFKLLGKTACEKRHREAFDFKEKAEKVVEEEHKTRRAKVVRRGEEEHNQNDDNDVMDDDDNVGNDDDDRHAFPAVEEEKEYTDDEDHAEEEEDNSDDDDYVVEEEEKEELGVEKGKKIRISEGKTPCVGLKKFGGTTNSKGKSVVKVNKERRTVESIEMDDNDDIFKSGQIVPPNNPFFVGKIRSSRRNELHVPSDVIKDYNIKLPKEIILCDPTGRRWSACVCTWKDGRKWVTRGWRRFCKWNNLKEEDRCICEFVQSEGQTGTFLMIHVIRAGSW